MTQLRVGETHTRARKAKLLRGAKASGRGYAALVEDETYTVDEAARILRLTLGLRRQMLRDDELEGPQTRALCR